MIRRARRDRRGTEDPMIPGVHDSHLVGYGVDLDARRLSLSVQPGDGSAAPFAIGFEGYEAHCFPAPLLPAILDGIYTVDAAQLLRDEWPAIAAGYKICGWPGAWGESLAAALTFVASHQVNAFRIESSYGLSGWVLARSVARL
jgi:hypothetical protein